MVPERSMTLAELRQLPVTVDLLTAARALGLGRTTAYGLARAGQFPCPLVRAGRGYRVPTAALLRTLGIDPATVIAHSPDTADKPPSSGDTTDVVEPPPPLPRQRRRVAGSRGLRPRRPR